MATKKPPVQKCKTCGGGRAHHSGMDNDGCWCPDCLAKPVAERCHSWQPGPLVDRNVAPVGAAHPWTARRAAEKVLPRTGSKRRKIYDEIAKARGATDDDLEYVTGWSHQSVSAARNTLMNDGLIEDSGFTKKTRHGHDAIVWRVKR